MCKEEACNFQFRLLMGTSGRWVLKGTRKNKGQHCGHFRMKPSMMCVPVKLMTTEEQKLGRDCETLGLSVPASTELINVRNENGLSFDDEQIRYLNKKEQEKVLGLSPDATSADSLIKSFVDRDDVNFMSITFSPAEGMWMSMTNPQRKKATKDRYLNRMMDDGESLISRKDLNDIYNSSIVGSSFSGLNGFDNDGDEENSIGFCTTSDTFDGGDGFELSLSQADETTKWKNGDVQFTQKSQLEAAKVLERNSNTKYKKLHALTQELLKIVEDDQDVFDSSLQMMKDVINTCRGTIAAKAFAKHGSNDEGDSAGTFAVETGKTKLKRMKRKKGFYEK